MQSWQTAGPVEHKTLLAEFATHGRLFLHVNRPV